MMIVQLVSFTRIHLI